MWLNNCCMFCSVLAETSMWKQPKSFALLCAWLWETTLSVLRSHLFPARTICASGHCSLNSVIQESICLKLTSSVTSYTTTPARWKVVCTHRFVVKALVSTINCAVHTDICLSIKKSCHGSIVLLASCIPEMESETSFLFSGMSEFKQLSIAKVGNTHSKKKKKKRCTKEKWTMAHWIYWLNHRRCCAHWYL